jgi:rhamnosyltransferase
MMAKASAAVPPFVVVIPTRNAGAFAAPMLAALQAQTARPLDVLVIDSDSNDGTPQHFAAAGCRVHPIAASSFDHGGTRNLGVTLADARAELLVFLTQDAVPAGPDALAQLLAPFADPLVAMAYGRQLPRQQANAIERHARLFNYGPVPVVRKLPQARALGIKAVFVSNSFAAYRRQALQALGGFPSPVIMGEDQVFAARALLAGWSLAYAAAAEAVHSHGYTPLQEFHRYFDTGVYHAAFPLIGEQFGGVGGEGLAFIRSELRHLAREAPHLLAVAPLYWAAKIAGYRVGKLSSHLPASLCRALAMHKGHFRRPAGKGLVPASYEAAD